MKKSVIAFGILFSVMANSNPTTKITSEKKTTITNVAPITLAIVQNDFTKVENFIALGTSVELKDKTTGMTPVMYAARYNKVELIKLLVDNGANVQEKSKLGLTALEYAKYANANDAVAYLTTITNVAPISLAIVKNDYATVKKLIAVGSDVKAVAKKGGLTPLMYASRYNQIALLKILIDNGADITAKSKIGATALDYAKAAGAKSTLGYLNSL